MVRMIDFETDKFMKNYYLDAVKYPEWATKTFWLYVLSHCVFQRAAGWNVSSEYPPVPEGSLRRVDLVVHGWEGDHKAVVLWSELKKSSAPGQTIGEVETQGFSAGLEFLMHGKTGRDAVWIMTATGPYARVWACVHKPGQGSQTNAENMMLKPIYPMIHSHGDKTTYPNLHGNEVLFQALFELIQRNCYPTADWVSKYVRGELPGTLMDRENATHVIVLKVLDNDVECQQVCDGSIVSVGGTWYPSFVIHQNTKVDCFHCYEDPVWYWTWDLNPRLR